MYQCINCKNREIFTEHYTEEVKVYISKEGDFCNSEGDRKLIEIVCDKCNNSTEDKSIADLEGEPIIIDNF